MPPSPPTVSGRLPQYSAETVEEQRGPKFYPLLSSWWCSPIVTPLLCSLNLMSWLCTASFPLLCSGLRLACDVKRIIYQSFRKCDEEKGDNSLYAFVLIVYYENIVEGRTCALHDAGGGVGVPPAGIYTRTRPMQRPVTPCNRLVVNREIPPGHPL